MTIPASVTTIGNFAFRNCETLTGISIPASVTAIGRGAFAGCENLTGITVNGGSSFSSEDGALFNADKTTLIRYPPAKSGGAGTYTRSGAGASESPYVWTKQGGD
ncbi:MAG: leucine-rich repeat domain-containing protein [Spirochaetaceae bacterium]|nr:leucine-rich repeat domain-containing protein [Spirochaetaceae bacterium]